MKKMMILGALLVGSFSTLRAENPTMAAAEAEVIDAAGTQEVLPGVIPAEYAPKAPDFTLANAAGKEVSLSEFRGQWVIVDFWGSWCGWCIKGMPKLKAAYAEYKDRVEVIGVDCGDSHQQWLEAVKRYELPWINLYTPEDETANLLASYGVQGFPTKLIIDPEGRIRNFTAGENPAFYEALAYLLGK